MGNGGEKMLEEKGEGEVDKERQKENESLFSSTAESFFFLITVEPLRLKGLRYRLARTFTNIGLFHKKEK